MLKTHYLSKIHLTGIKVPFMDTDLHSTRYPMHWRITAECRFKDKDKKKEHKTKAIDSKSKAHGSKKAEEKPKVVFIAIDLETKRNDIMEYDGKIPAQML